MTAKGHRMESNPDAAEDSAFIHGVCALPGKPPNFI